MWGPIFGDCPPFASLHKGGLTEQEEQKWNAIYREGIALEAEGLHEQAIERYVAAAEIDDTFADLQFRLGRNYWETGSYEQARHHYQLALQNDTLRFRADAQISTIIRRTADGRTDEGIYFADAVAAFEANSPHQIPGSELFYEHVHLTFKGNYILARTFYPFIQHLLPSTAKPRGDLLSEEQLARRIAYTEYDEFFDLNTMYEVYLNKPPFTNQLYHDESMRNMKTELERRRGSLDLPKCVEEYDRAFRENPDDWRLPVKRYSLVFVRWD